LGLAIGLILMALGGTYLAYDSLPPQVPVHWNIRGQVDGFAPKTWGVWLLPGAMVLLLGLFAVLPRISPRHFEIDTFRATYEFIALLVIALFGFLQVITIAQARNQSLNAGVWLANGMYLFFALLGNVMGKIRRNYFVGIRVPWTLSSERVWNDTHRLAAWLWTGAGLLGLLFGLLGQIAVGIGLIALAVIVPIVYSYLHYKELDRRGEIEAPPA
jgi:uncharacterized membrane protein